MMDADLYIQILATNPMRIHQLMLLTPMTCRLMSLKHLRRLLNSTL